MVPGVAGSIPVGHPEAGAERAGRCAARHAGRCRTGGLVTASRSEVRSSIGRAPVSKTGGWGFDSLRACRDAARVAAARWGAGGKAGWQRGISMAVSSRGLGHSPLKAGTRVRIPLPLLCRRSSAGPRLHRLSVRTRPFQGRETGSIPVGAIAPAGAEGGSRAGVGAGSDVRRATGSSTPRSQERGA